MIRRQQLTELQRAALFDPPTDRRELLKTQLMIEIQGSRPDPTTRRSWPRLIAIGGALATATVLLGASLLGRVAEPAYAVERTHDGVHVSIRDARKLGGLSGRLDALGYSARVVPITVACSEAPATPMPSGLAVYVDSLGPNAANVDLIGGPLPAGKTVTLGIESNPHGVIIDGEVSAGHRTCFPMPNQ